MEHNQQLSMSSRVLILLFMGAVLPSVALLMFFEQLARVPLFALSLGFLYEIALFIIGFRFRLSPTHPPAIYHPFVDQRHGLEFEPSISRPLAQDATYRADYLKQLVAAHCEMHITGVTTALQVEQLFIELLLTPSSQLNKSNQPVWMSPTELRSGPQPIWTYLQLQQNFLIIASPGSGKSTLLKYVTLAVAGKLKRHKDIPLPNMLPIFVTLSHHITSIQRQPNFSLIDTIIASVRGASGVTEPWTEVGWLEEQLERGDCLVLLDGLDETMDAHKQVITWLLKQIKQWPNNRFVVTAHRSQQQLTGFTVLNVQPLSRDKVVEFVHNWYKVHEATLPFPFRTNSSSIVEEVATPITKYERLTRVKQQANDLLQQIHSTHGLSELAVNPLFLTMMAITHRYRGQVTLPRRFDWVGPPPKTGLYREFSQQLFENELPPTKSKRKWAQKKPTLTPKQKKSLLQPLAFHMMCHQQREISSEEALTVIAQPLAQAGQPKPEVDLLQRLVKNTRLIIECKKDHYAFAHHTLQEYLTTLYLLEQQLGEGLHTRVKDEWWHESIRLYCAKTKSTAIVQACLDHDTLSSLILAASCLEETDNIRPAVYAEVIARLQQGVEKNDLEWHKRSAEALLSLRLRKMKRVTDHKYVDYTLITHAEYQLFLDKEHANGQYYQPAHWINDHFPSGMGNTAAVGISPKAAIAFCDWLTQQLPTTQWHYRLPTIEELSPESIEIHTRKPVSLGYWATVGDDIEYIEVDPLVPMMTSERLWELVNNDRARAFDQSLDLDRALANALGLDLNHTLQRYSYRALDHYHALDPYLNQALTLVSDRPCDFDRYRARDLTRYRDLDPDRARELARHRHLDVDLYLYDDLYRALYLVLNLDRDLYLDPTIAPSYDRYQISRFLRWYVRYCALILGTTVAQIMVEQPVSWVAPLQIGQGSKDAELESLIATYTELYVTFTILEERVRGNQPAFEGIRIVMERAEL